jgi:D-alanyl-D-alanine carboxypeptidase
MPPPPIDAAYVARLIHERLDGKTPGAAVAMTSADNTVFTTCHGYADLEGEVPVTPTTVFNLASLTKPFTALTALLLEKDGILDLDAPLCEYLPEFDGAAAQVNVHQLLTHTAGVQNVDESPEYKQLCRLDQTQDELIAECARLPLSFQSGSRFGYSNTGYRLVEIIAARAAGKPFAEVLTERVFAPTGMSNSRLLTDTEIVRCRARGYASEAGGFTNSSYMSMTKLGGAGGIGSTLEDLVRFDRAMRTESIADAALQRRMFSPARLPHRSTEGYGLGWQLKAYRGHRLFFHTGGVYGFSSLYARLADDDVGIIVLTNVGYFPCAKLACDLINSTLGLPTPKHSAVHLPERDLEARTGRYHGTTYHFDVAVRNGILIVSQFDRIFTMLPTGPATFVGTDDPDMRLDFHDDDPASPGTLHYPLWWCTGYRNTR